MVRKKRNQNPGGGESSQPQEGGGGSDQSSQRSSPAPAPAPAPQQYYEGGRGGGPGGYQGGGGGGPGGYQGGGGGPGGYQGGRAWAQQGPQGGQRGYGGGGGGRGRGMPPQQQYGYGGPSPSPSQAPEFRGRSRGGQGGGGRGGTGSGGSGRGRWGGGPSFGGGSARPSVPDLHQATSAPYVAGVTPQATGPAPSSSYEPQPSVLVEPLHQMTIQQEGVPAPSPGNTIQPIPASSKSVRFPLRPGKGTTGIKCIVKANHFFAELPDKDLHQYDVSYFTVHICLCPSHIVLKICV